MTETAITRLGVAVALLVAVLAVPDVRAAGNAPHAAQSDAVRLDDGYALIRFKGMTVLVDPDSNAAMLPPVDLVLLRGCGAAQLAWLARQRLDRAVVVIANADGPCVTGLRGQGVRRVQVLGMWGAYTLAQGGVTLRLTVMPAARSADDAAGVMMDFASTGRSSYRIYAGGEADDGALASLPERFPGADLAIVRRDGVPLLAAMAAERDGRRNVRPVEAAFRIIPVKR